MWHISLAKYNRKHNAVAERRVKNFIDYEDAINYLEKYAEHAIYLWHDNACYLDNPDLLIGRSLAYKNEYRKIKN